MEGVTARRVTAVVAVLRARPEATFLGSLFTAAVMISSSSPPRATWSLPPQSEGRVAPGLSPQGGSLSTPRALVTRAAPVLPGSTRVGYPLCLCLCPPPRRARGFAQAVNGKPAFPLCQSFGRDHFLPQRGERTGRGAARRPFAGSLVSHQRALDFRNRAPGWSSREILWRFFAPSGRRTRRPGIGSPGLGLSPRPAVADTAAQPSVPAPPQRCLLAAQ